jgi:hypothetical protein
MQDESFAGRMVLHGAAELPCRTNQARRCCSCTYPDRSREGRYPWRVSLIRIEPHRLTVAARLGSSGSSIRGSEIRRSVSAAAVVPRKSTPLSTAKAAHRTSRRRAGRPTTIKSLATHSTLPVRHHQRRQGLRQRRKYASRSRMRALCRPSPATAMPLREPIGPSAFADDDTKPKTTFDASKTGGRSPRATTNSPETSLTPRSSSAHSTESSCESR